MNYRGITAYSIILPVILRLHVNIKAYTLKCHNHALAVSAAINNDVVVFYLDVHCFIIFRS